MSKELTPLQALREIYINCKVDLQYNFKIIETALKDYENLQLKHRSMQDAVLDDFKNLKALEIIKNNFEITKLPRIDIKNKKVTFGCLVQKKSLTLEEFDLLKEVLL